MFAVPADSPVTIPEMGSTVPIAVLLLLHEPPIVASLSVVVSPTHTFVVPVIAATALTTVTVSDVAQVVGSI